MSGEPGTGDSAPASKETLREKTEALVKWMGLENVPNANTLDPDNKIGLQGAYVSVDGSYTDPIPASVLDAAQRELDGKEKNGGYVPPIEISLLKDQFIPYRQDTSKTISFGARHIPLFAEQVRSVAQYLVNLGLEIPATEGKDFTLPQIKETDLLRTKNSNISAKFYRNADIAHVSEVSLIVFPQAK